MSGYRSAPSISSFGSRRMVLEWVSKILQNEHRRRTNRGIPRRLHWGVLRKMRRVSAALADRTRQQMNSHRVPAAWIVVRSAVMEPISQILMGL